MGNAFPSRSLVYDRDNRKGGQPGDRHDQEQRWSRQSESDHRPQNPDVQNSGNGADCLPRTRKERFHEIGGFCKEVGEDARICPDISFQGLSGCTCTTRAGLSPLITASTRQKQTIRGSGEH